MKFFKKLWRKVGFKDQERIDTTREHVGILSDHIHIETRHLKSSIASEAEQRQKEDNRLRDLSAQFFH